MSWPSWLDCRNTRSRSSLSASDWHSFSTSASEVEPYTSGLRVPSRLRLGPFSTKTEVMVALPSGKKERPGRRGGGAAAVDGGVGSDGGRDAEPLVLLAGHLGRVLLPEVVQVHAVGLARRPRRDRGDDPDPEGDAADDQRHVRPARRHLCVDRRQEGGDQGADVLR